MQYFESSVIHVSYLYYREKELDLFNHPYIISPPIILLPKSQAPVLDQTP
jgi:hypothetical protein